jgi:hypothetical protein
LKPLFHRRTFWSIAGLFLLGFAGWEAVQLNSGGRKAFADALSPPPLRSRSGERPLAVREKETGDPVANYLARAKRGMTEQEARWMLEDFEAQGLDRSEDQLSDTAAAKAQRKRQEAWYLAALSEGLSLTPGQKEEMKAGLDVRFESDLQRLEELKSSSGERGERRPGYIFLGGSDLWDAYEQFYRFSVRLFNDSAFAPWNVTQLSEDQTAITLRYWLIDDWKRLDEDSPFGPFDSPDRPEPWFWLYDKERYNPFAEPERKTVIQDPTTGNLLENRGPVIYREHVVRSGVFAFTPDQIPSWNEADSLLSQAMSCHPAQLRMALLEEPKLARWMRAELDGTAPRKSE